MTLSQALLPVQSLTTRALMVLGGTAFLALAAQISVPMIPVPMTLQTLAVLIVGLVYGARMGTLTVAAYLAEGAAGLPVFANGSFGLFGPTTGFLLGFLAIAWIAGTASDRGVKRFLPVTLVALVASAVVYLPGVAWLAGYIGLEKAVAAGMLPFLAGDAVKSVIAALVVTGGWAALSARRG